MAGHVWHLVKLDSPTANHSSIHQSYSTHAQRITAHTHGTQQTTNLGEYSPRNRALTHGLP